LVKGIESAEGFHAENFSSTQVFTEVEAYSHLAAFAQHAAGLACEEDIE
jgi:hypothetical protein